PEWCQAFWGTVNIGGICVGLNGWWKEDEILYGLTDSGAKILVADKGRFARIANEIAALDSIEKIFLVDADPAEFGSDPRLRRFDELLAEPTSELPDVAIAEDDPAVIFYTSATTGRPKGVTTTHRAWIASMHSIVAYLFAAAMSDPETAAQAAGARVGLLTLPLFHVGGCQSNMFIGFFAGRTIVIPEGRVTPEKCLELIQSEKITDFGAVPTIVWRVCTHPERHGYDLSTVTAVSYGGAPPPLQLQEMVRETFPNAQRPAQVWGLTESSSAITLCAGEDFRSRPASTGRALPTVELRICDEQRRERPPGEAGEIVVRGPMIVPGYWGKPEATADTFSPDGWLYT
ncbi:MAG: AMP-binding protein, partial [Candidatus Binatia bacterium]